MPFSGDLIKTYMTTRISMVIFLPFFKGSPNGGLGSPFRKADVPGALPEVLGLLDADGQAQRKSLGAHQGAKCGFRSSSWPSNDGSIW